MSIIINPADIERVVAANPATASNALSYFSRRPLKNSAYAAVRDIEQEIGNVPVVARGDTGIRPKSGSSVGIIEPMPIEIDDQFSAVELDTYERSSLGGKQQLIDEKLQSHLTMIRATTKALCIMAHRGKIDYMMKSGSTLVRYTVVYGAIATGSNATAINKLTPGVLIQACNDGVDLINGNNIGGQVEIIAERELFSNIVNACANQTAYSVDVGPGYITIGGFKILLDIDSYVDISTTGVKSTKRMLQARELMFRAVDAGQSLPYYKIDDVVMREAVPFYSFTKDRGDQRGTDIYSKSKPFPLINTKGISIITFAVAS